MVLRKDATGPGEEVGYGGIRWGSGREWWGKKEAEQELQIKTGRVLEVGFFDEC